MKIVQIYGQNHEGSTCNIARMLSGVLGGEIKEFFLPRDFGEFCVGCNTCFTDETKCPHYEKLKDITDAINDADVIILASPVYVFHATGAMKALLDHYGYRWMVHRPEEKMFSKQAVVISTAAGGGMKNANKDMADSTFFWGCAKTYRLGIAVREVYWSRVSPKIKVKTERKIKRLARKLQGNYGRVKPSIKTKVFFCIMRMVQKNGWNEADVTYWKEKGWLGKTKPWKK